MKLGTALDDFMEEKLLSIHTAFIGKVEAVHGGKAKVQPLSMIRQYGENAIQPAVIDDVPIPKSLYKIEIETWDAAKGVAAAGAVAALRAGAGAMGAAQGALASILAHPLHKHTGHVRLIPVQVGDICLCVCVDRDISETQNGSMALPVVGHHEIKDAVMVHILSSW